jgi:hypothetical protein
MGIQIDAQTYNIFINHAANTVSTVSYPLLQQTQGAKITIKITIK